MLITNIQVIEGMDDATLDAKVLEYVPGYPDTISVAAVVGYLCGLPVEARRVHAVRRAFIRLGNDDRIKLIERETWSLPMPHPATKSRQCRFHWLRPYNGGQRQHLCIRHQGHKDEHSDAGGKRPTNDEYVAAKADGAADV